jgi:hypothetical protein
MSIRTQPGCLTHALCTVVFGFHCGWRGIT